jgi:hypothetical protein
MFPHADTIYTINTLDHEQKVRHAVKQRLAATAPPDEPSPSIMSASTRQVRTTLVGGLLRRWHGATWVRLLRQLLRGSAEPVHRVI